MSSPVNIQRDAFYVDPGQNSKAWSDESTVGATTPVTNILPVVNYDFGFITSSRATATITAGNYRAIGLAMSAPVGDRWPYRLKGAASIVGTRDVSTILVVGWADADLSTGDNININSPTYLPFEKGFDTTIMVEPQTDLDPYYGRALIFSIAVTPDAQSTTSNTLAHLSVQSMGVKPPTMHNAVS